MIGRALRAQHIARQSQLLVECENKHRSYSKRIEAAKSSGDMDTVAKLVDERYEADKACKFDLFGITAKLVESITK